MAKSPNGLYGALSGRLGNTVHYVLNGQHIVRMVGVNTKPPTVKQKANRQAMSVIMDLLRPALRFVNAGFGLEAMNTVCNAHNLAVSYNKKHALQGEYPNLSVDYSKVQFSRGVLPLPDGLRMEKEGNGIRISWNPEHLDKGDSPDNIVMVMLLKPGQSRGDCMLNAGKRSEGSCFIELETGHQSQTEVYICFKSSSGKSISNTAYVGNLNGVTENKENQVKKEKRTKDQARFDQVRASYFKQIKDNGGINPQDKRFRCLEKEYIVLKRRLEKPS